ncbi:hypothetical protein Taro_000211, partial [Colocasia esculenta]|nr:hypothetical protein [Colocasia esculenta]
LRRPTIALALHDNALSLVPPRHGKALALHLPRPALTPCHTTSPFLPPSLPPQESGVVPEEEDPTLALTTPSPLAPATFSQSMEGISLLQLPHYSGMVSTVAFRFCIGTEVGATPEQPWQHTRGVQEILEAITTLRCCEDFSLELFGLLGDFVLKFTVVADPSWEEHEIPPCSSLLLEISSHHCFHECLQ